MAKIDDLIEKLCPNGVEYKPIWSLTAWDKKFNGVDKEKQKKIISYKYYLSTDFAKVERKDGNIKYISTGISGDDRYTTEELAGDYLADGEVVCIPWGGTPNVKYHKGKFVTGDNRIATSLDINILSNKFLYYWMQSKINVISKFYRGSGIKHPSMKDVLDMNIAVPPLEVQCEIVHILDDFTLLSAELSAELEARQKQYEYYNKLLLSFDNSIPVTKLRDIIDFKNGKGHENVVEKNGKYILVTSKAISTDMRNVRKTDRNLVPLYYEDIVMVMSDLPNGKALAKCFLVDEDEKYTLNQRIGCFTNKREDIINTKFLYYILNRNSQLLKYDNGVEQTNLRKDDILNIDIPIPKKEQQIEIIKVLDKFDKLCNGISEGLPAEIEVRKKQYEYYRDKLLTFKELKVNE
jgi:type I restriction enzyme S subunit